MIQDIFKAFQYYRRAASLISKHRLWRYVILPGLLSTLVMGLLIAGPVLGFINSDLSASLVNAWPFEFGKGLVEGLSGILVGLLSITLVFFLGKYVILIVASPFMGPLSEKMETIVRGYKVEITSNFLADLIRGIRISLRNLIREILLTFLFLLFNLIPLIGSIVGTILTFSIEAYYAGFGNMDYTLERKHYSVKQSVAFVGQNRGLAIGNGIVFLLMLMIPVIGWFLAPAYGAGAATLASIERMDKLKAAKPN
ncbi:MAG: EI24 domain-containing protein [Bacteroidota bacterium]